MQDVLATNEPNALDLRRAIENAVRSHKTWTSTTTVARRKELVPLDLRASAWDDTRKFRLVYGMDIYIEYELIRQHEPVGTDRRLLSLSCYKFDSTTPFICFRSQYSSQGSVRLDGNAAGFEIKCIARDVVRAAHCTLQSDAWPSTDRSQL